MDQETFEKVGKYSVWLVVLLGFGWSLGLLAQIAMFVLPGVLVVAAVWYIGKSMKNEGIVTTIKDIMKEPIEWIKAVGRTFLPGLFK